MPSPSGFTSRWSHDRAGFREDDQVLFEYFVEVDLTDASVANAVATWDRELAAFPVPCGVALVAPRAALTPMSEHDPVSDETHLDTIATWLALEDPEPEYVDLMLLFGGSLPSGWDRAAAAVRSGRSARSCFSAVEDTPRIRSVLSSALPLRRPRPT